MLEDDRQLRKFPVENGVALHPVPGQHFPRERLLHHDNVEAIQLLDNSELIRRLRRTKPFELV
jgi:hypothetical protein